MSLKALIPMTVLTLATLTATADAKIKKSCWIKPCQIVGDFDGDKKLDKAVLVENQSHKKGIAFYLGNGKRVLFGAGEDFGNGGDDFSWMDHWELERGPIQQGNTDYEPPKSQGDNLLVEQTESASGLIYWNGTRFRWYQQGD